MKREDLTRKLSLKPLFIILIALFVLTLSIKTIYAAFISYDPAVNYATGDNARGIAIGDFDGDNKPDIATANSSSNNISILINNGDATYKEKVDYQGGSAPYNINSVDINKDTVADLIICNYTTAEIGVMIGNGDGTFQERVGYAAGNGPRHSVAEDLDGDTNVDIVVANYSSDTISVLMGNGDGTFDPKVDYSSGLDPVMVAVTDINKDGNKDFASVNFSSHSISIFTGNGNGTFQGKVDIATSQAPRSFGVGDFNNDTFPDFVTANLWDENISVLLGNGNGTFMAPTNYNVYMPNCIVTGDYNNDGRDDIALTANDNVNFYITFFISVGDGTFTQSNRIIISEGAFRMTAGQLNTDGYLDLITTNYDDTLSVFLRFVDIVKPTIGFSSTVKSSGKYVRGSFLYPVKSSDAGTGIEKMRLYDGATTILKTIYTSSYSFTVNTTKLTGGKHTFKAIAYDRAGNTNLVSRYYYVDNYKPRTSAPYKATVKKGSYAKLYYKVPDKFSPKANVKIKIKNSKGNVVKTLSLGFVYTNKLLNKSVLASLPVGTYTFHIYATDKAGNPQYNIAKNNLIIK